MAAALTRMERRLYDPAPIATTDETADEQAEGLWRSAEPRRANALDGGRVRRAVRARRNEFAKDAKSDAYKAINPNQRIPAIDDDGVIVWESMAINLYLSEEIRR